jgi:hypothetical protein
MSIRSDKNKKLLTTLLLEHPLLKRNPEHFHHILIQELERLHSDRFNYKSNLMLMNKEILRKFQSIANQMISEKPKTPVKEIIEQTFENRLKETKENFEKMIRSEPPDEIDFTDKTGEIPVGDNELDYTMAKRENELKKIMNSQTKNKNVEAWLNGESDTKPIRDSSVNIKIDHLSNVKLNTIPIKHNEKKRVTFNIKESGLKDVPNNLFSKLKLKSGNISYETGAVETGAVETGAVETGAVETGAVETGKTGLSENNQLLKEILDNQKRIIQLLGATLL